MQNKKEAGKRMPIKTVPKVIVSCKGRNGEENALAVSCCCNCSFSPPMVIVGIVPSRYSYHLIKETGKFAVNLVGENCREMFEYLGKKSGKDEDKLANYSTLAGLKVDVPILSDCPINIECTVVDSIVTGSHEMFVGQVEYVHADENLFDEEGKIDYTKINFL